MITQKILYRTEQKMDLILKKILKIEEYIIKKEGKDTKCQK